AGRMPPRTMHASKSARKLNRQPWKNCAHSCARMAKRNSCSEKRHIKTDGKLVSMARTLPRERIPGVMISSTVLDLPRHRAAVRDACIEAKMLPLPMESEPASGKHKVPASLAMVDRADIFVGIIGWRYGEIPEGFDKSITEMEYD